MRRKTRLMTIVLFVVAGLSWFYWKDQQKPLAMYVFDFEARVEGETVSFQSAVGCYAFEVGTGTPFESATIHAIREPAFSTKLKSGRTFFVSVPDICPYAKRPDGEFLHQVRNSNWREWQRPSISTPHEIIPLTYITDEREKPQTVRLFTSTVGRSSSSAFEVLRSTVRQYDETTDSNIRERSSDRSDPFTPSLGFSKRWMGVVFLPVLDAPPLVPAWVEDRWAAGACEIVRLSKHGRDTMSALDAYSRSVGPLWPRLWGGMAISDLFAIPTPEKYDPASVRAGLDSVIPVHWTGDRFEVEPEHSGTIELFSVDASEMLFRPSAYHFKGVQLSDSSERQRLPFVIRCVGQRGLYVPTILYFSRRVL